MNKIFLIFFLFPMICFAQQTTVDRPDESIEPRPYEKTYLQDNNNYQIIKSITTIVKHRYTDFTIDTFKKVYYNTTGNKRKSIRYDKNQPTQTTFFEYYPNEKIKSWKTDDGRSTTYTKYLYNKDDKITSTN